MPHETTTANLGFLNIAVPDVYEMIKSYLDENYADAICASDVISLIANVNANIIIGYLSPDKQAAEDLAKASAATTKLYLDRMAASKPH
jgi:hypothetical protein